MSTGAGEPAVTSTAATWSGTGRAGRSTEAGALVFAAIALAALLTYPLVLKIDRAGRVVSGDGQYSIWNVAWVAHALVARPDRLFDANIFYPHRNTLAFSEANLVAGAMAVPAYWLTRNPYVAHHSVVLLGFALSAIGMYLLVRYLTGHRGAAAVAAVTYAYCPFVLARLPHIQLLMIFGLPFVLLALHAFVDRLGVLTALGLAASLIVTALACGYYGIFAVLIAGLGLPYFALSRRLWRRARFWILSGSAAVLSMLAVYPFLRRYAMLGFGGGDAFRSLEESAWYSADWLAYLTAGGWGNRWMMQTWGRGNEVLFPGFVALALGLIGIVLGVRRRLARRRQGAPITDGAKTPGNAPAPAACSCEVLVFHVLVGGLALWLSFGPDAGLYTLCYDHVPAFTLLRAPARIGIVVTLALSVIGGMGLATLLRGRRRGALIAAAVAAVAILELAQIPLNFPNAPLRVGAYDALARLPRGPVAEFPFFWRREDFHRHAYYMLNSTWHWQPLVNGYSDYIPPDFREVVGPLSTFPSREAFAALAERHVLYVVIHVSFYDRRSKERLFDGLTRYAAYLRPIVRENNVWLYEIVAFP